MTEREKLNKITEAVIGAALVLPATQIQPLPECPLQATAAALYLAGWLGRPTDAEAARATVYKEGGKFP
jgi:hypothetical protein